MSPPHLTEGHKDDSGRCPKSTQPNHGRAEPHVPGFCTPISLVARPVLLLPFGKDPKQRVLCSFVKYGNTFVGSEGGPLS